jgi:hypothetical protein
VHVEDNHVGIARRLRDTAREAAHTISYFRNRPGALRERMPTWREEVPRDVEEDNYTLAHDADAVCFLSGDRRKPRCVG